MASATELAPEGVDCEALVKPFPLQPTECPQTTRAVRQLSALRPCLTAREPELIRTSPEDCLDVRPYRLPATDRRGRQRPAIGGAVWGAVSDAHDRQAPRQPTSLRPGGRSPSGPPRVGGEPTVRREPTAAVPPVIATPLEPHLGRVPRIEKDRRRTTAPPMTGIAESCQGECRRRRAALVPEAQPAWEAHGPLSPDQERE